MICYKFTEKHKVTKKLCLIQNPKIFSEQIMIRPGMKICRGKTTFILIQKYSKQ